MQNEVTFMSASSCLAPLFLSRFAILAMPAKMDTSSAQGSGTNESVNKGIKLQPLVGWTLLDFLRAEEYKSIDGITMGSF